MKPTPEQIDALARSLGYIGIKVPPRDTAFFQATVRQWLKTIDMIPPRRVTDETIGEQK